MTVILIRHAECKDNVADVFDGWRNSSLTKKGIMQAKNLAKKITLQKTDEVISSDLLRAKKTAQFLFVNHDISYTNLLRERSYGSFEGKKHSNVRKIVGEKTYRLIRRGWDYPIPNGESIQQLFNRAKKIVTTFRLHTYLSLKKRIYIVSHNNMIRALECLLRKKEYSFLKRKEYKHCLLYEVKI
jgi:broad specificity phosphatase PhoE